MEGVGKLKGIKFYCLSIGVSILLAAFSFFIFNLNIGYRWYVASIICGTCSLTIAAFTFGCVVEHVRWKRRRAIRLTASEGQTGDNLEMLDTVNSDANVYPADSHENYVEFFCFMKTDQSIGRSLHDESCMTHEINIQQSNSSQHKHGISTYYKDPRKLTLTNNTQVNSQFAFPNRRDSLYCSVKHISEQCRLGNTPIHSESSTSNCVPGSMQEPISTSTVTMESNQNVSPINLKSSNQLQSLEYVHDAPELPLVNEREPIHPTRLDIPDNLSHSDSDELRDLANHKKGSQSPVMIHDGHSSLNEGSYPILGRDHEELSLQNQATFQNGSHIERACVKAPVVFESGLPHSTVLPTSSP